MNEVKKCLVGLTVLLFITPMFASPLKDCENLDDCDAQACVVNYKISVMKRQHRDKEIEELTLELNEITEYCESDKQRKIFVDKMSDLYKEVSINKVKLNEATKYGNTELVDKYKNAIEKDQRVIDKMSRQLEQMKTSVN